MESTSGGKVKAYFIATLIIAVLLEMFRHCLGAWFWRLLLTVVVPPPAIGLIARVLLSRAVFKPVGEVFE